MSDVSQSAEQGSQDGVDLREPGTESEDKPKRRKKKRRVVKRSVRKRKKGEPEEPLGEGDTVEYRVREDGKRVKVIRRVRKVKKKKKRRKQQSADGAETRRTDASDADVAEKSDAVEAKSDADAVADKSDAAEAKSDAVEAKSDAVEAKSDAVEAKSDADAVADKSDAAEAKSDAAEAKSDADAVADKSDAAEAESDADAVADKSDDEARSDADAVAEKSDAEAKSDADAVAEKSDDEARSDADAVAEKSDAEARSNADAVAEKSDAEAKSDADAVAEKSDADDSGKRPSRRSRRRRRKKRRRGSARSERAGAVSDALDEADAKAKKKPTDEPKKRAAIEKISGGDSSDLAAAFDVEADREQLEDAIGKERFEDSQLAVELDAMPVSSRLDKDDDGKPRRKSGRLKGALLDSSDTMIKPTRSRRLKSTRSSESAIDSAVASDNGNGAASTVDSDATRVPKEASDSDDSPPPRRRKRKRKRKGHRRRSEEKLAIASADLLDPGLEVEELDESDFAGIPEDDEDSDAGSGSDVDQDSSDLEGSSERRTRIAAAWGKPKQTVVSRGKKGPAAKRRKAPAPRPRGRRRSDAEIAADLPELRRRGGNKMLAPMIVIGCMVVSLGGVAAYAAFSGPDGKSKNQLRSEAARARSDALRDHADALFAEAKRFADENPDRHAEARAKLLAIIDTLDAHKRHNTGQEIIAAATTTRQKVESLLNDLNREHDDAGHEAYEALRTRADQKVAEGDFVGANAIYDEFPVYLRDTRWWHQNVRADREKLARGKIAREEAAPLIARAKELASAKKYDQALGVLAAFSDSLRGTAAHDEVSETRHGIRNREVKLAEAAERRKEALAELGKTNEEEVAVAKIDEELEKKFAGAQWEPLLGEDLFNWQILLPRDSQTWKIQNGSLVGNNSSGRPMVCGMKKSWRDFVIQYRCRVVKGGYAAMARLDLIPIGPGGQGGARLGARSIQMPSPDSEWHRIQLWVVGNSVMVSVDGGEKKPLAFQDENARPIGGIGFAVPPASHIELQEIQVKVLEQG